jgi:hypothetical protein
MLKSEIATSVKIITFGTKGFSALRPISSHNAAVTSPATMQVMILYNNDLFFMMVELKKLFNFCPKISTPNQYTGSNAFLIANEFNRPIFTLHNKAIT